MFTFDGGSVRPQRPRLVRRVGGSSGRAAGFEALAAGVAKRLPWQDWRLRAAAHMPERGTARRAEVRLRSGRLPTCGAFHGPSFRSLCATVKGRIRYGAAWSEGGATSEAVIAARAGRRCDRDASGGFQLFVRSCLGRSALR